MQQQFESELKHIQVVDEEGNEYILKLVYICEFKGKGYGIFELEKGGEYAVFLLDGIEKDPNDYDDEFDFIMVKDKETINAIFDIYEKEMETEFELDI